MSILCLEAGVSLKCDHVQKYQSHGIPLKLAWFELRHSNSNTTFLRFVLLHILKLLLKWPCLQATYTVQGKCPGTHCLHKRDHLTMNL